MKCIIIDDDVVSQTLLESYCKAFNIELVDKFKDAVNGLKWVINNQIDLLLLDIHMPQLSGIDIIQTLKNPPKIVLITSDPQYAVKAFEFPFVIDYILKPVTLERFGKIMNKLKPEKPKTTALTKSQNATNDYIFVNIDKRIIKIKTEDISYIKANGDYVKINTNKKNFLVHTPLKNIKEKLPSEVFFHVHRSFIINLNKIVDIELNSILIGENIIPISRSKKTSLMQRLNLI